MRLRGWENGRLEARRRREETVKKVKGLVGEGVVREILNPHAVLRNNKRFIATIKIIATPFY